MPFCQLPRSHIWESAGQIWLLARQSSKTRRICKDLGDKVEQHLGAVQSMCYIPKATHTQQGAIGPGWQAYKYL